VDRFRHHENHPLGFQVVVVDEASMMDLAMMDRLLGAVGPKTRLVLLGDADQLPSVDAGCVLRDLMLAGEAPLSPTRPAFACRLTRSYRMDPEDPAGRAILAAATEVNAGRAQALIAGDGRHVCRVEATDLPAFLADWYRRRIDEQPGYRARRNRIFRRHAGVLGAGDAADLRELIAVFERSRLLTVTRRMPTGAEAINRRMHELSVAAIGGSFRGEIAPGEPVVVRENDYERQLFNGDQGVIARIADDDRPRLRAVFARGDELVIFNLDVLRKTIDLAYAMTVHRSQGSEHEEVALILPARDLPISSRELIYTAVTRARRRVTVVGQSALLRAAVNRRVQRFSGVADRLRSPQAG
jgi:exodeoxyribonuclease V alpha subunit